MGGALSLFSVQGCCQGNDSGDAEGGVRYSIHPIPYNGAANPDQHGV